MNNQENHRRSDSGTEIELSEVTSFISSKMEDKYLFHLPSNPVFSKADTGPTTPSLPKAKTTAYLTATQPSPFIASL